MKDSVRRKLARKKRRRQRRIEKQNSRQQSPMLGCPKTTLELNDRTNAVNCGGLATVQQMVRQVGLAESINRHCPIFKMHMPYTEADHVLNIVDLLGAERIPDPTTAGDFCRRFTPPAVDRLMDAINETRIKVWQQQPDSFFDLATIEGDGTMVETTGEKKEGIGLNYKKQWGYEVLAITLANTREQLFLKNRPGNRPSHEGAAAYFDKSVELCRRAGFRKVRLRGDTDFSQTTHLDRWHKDGVEFVFGYDAAPNLVEKEYRNQILEDEDVAEFYYRPTACKRSYRLVVLRKTIRMMEGQTFLFHEPKYFFYITNLPKRTMPAKRIVSESNSRCDQENLFAQGKAMGALSAPLHDLTSNWAYMVMAMLAWNLKCWLGLSLKLAGNATAREKRTAAKQRVLRMDFSTFRQQLIQVPTQVLKQGRQLIGRLLQWTPSTELMFQLHDSVSIPLRH